MESGQYELYLAIVAAVVAVATKLIDAWQKKREECDDAETGRRKNHSDETDTDK